MTFAEHFTHLEDPRRAQGKLHTLADILTITLCAVLAGADGWDDIATFARIKRHWLTEHLALRHGVPSADTFRRVLAALDPEAFSRGFVRWVEAVAERTAGDIVAIDGKTLRRSYDSDDPRAMLHMVSAWSSRQHLVLAQQRVGDKSNEITAIPALVSVLDLTGCIVTLDAMGTQTEIARQICARQADYVLALKGNHRALHEEVCAYFDEARRADFARRPIGYAETKDIGHGRHEVRRAWSSSDVSWLPGADAWQGLASIVLVERARASATAGEPSVEQRYYLSSLGGGSACAAEQALDAVRRHWGIENEVHWVLDVVFREDESRIRRDHGGANLSVVRHVALNLLRRDATPKLSLRMKRKRAGWDDAFLEQLTGL